MGHSHIWWSAANTCSVYSASRSPTVFELLIALSGGRCAEKVAGLDRAVPAAQPLQALFFFVQLGQREFALADFAVDFRVELGAVGEELRPFLIPFSRPNTRRQPRHRLSGAGRRRRYDDVGRTPRQARELKSRSPLRATMIVEPS
jgi:hypothetical protein